MLDQDAVSHEGTISLLDATQPPGRRPGWHHRGVDDLWPLFQLCIKTPRLELRLPVEQEIAALARVAAQGVHEPSARPFLTPWTEGTAEQRSQAVLRGHRGALSAWSVDQWSLGLGVFLEGEPIGSIDIRAIDFLVVREVATSSWLGLTHHGSGLGTEARLGALTLAFDFLEAEAALSEVFQDNIASQGVSLKLGYEHDGISRDRRGSEALVSDRLRLTKQRWKSQRRSTVVITGFDACKQQFAV